MGNKMRKRYAIVLLIIASGAMCKGSPSRTREYKFTKDMFSGNVRRWERTLSRFKGVADVRYLEVGVYEGRSVIWMLENILTHPSARVTAIDLFPESRMKEKNYKKRFFDNIKMSGFENKVTTMIGMSSTELRKLPFNSFDIIYIDGSHAADDVLSDAVSAWPLLKNSGIIIFDDYNLGLAQALPIEFRPRLAIDAFITAYRNLLDIIVFERQVILRKRIPVFEGWDTKGDVPIGQYIYRWWTKQLYLAETKKPIEFTLSDKEIGLIELYIRSRNYLHKFLIPADKTLLKDKTFKSLRNKLKLDLYYRQTN